MPERVALGSVSHRRIGVDQAEHIEPERAPDRQPFGVDGLDSLADRWGHALFVVVELAVAVLDPAGGEQHPQTVQSRVRVVQAGFQNIGHLLDPGVQVRHRRHHVIGFHGREHPDRHDPPSPKDVQRIWAGDPGGIGQRGDLRNGDISADPVGAPVFGDVE